MTDKARAVIIGGGIAGCALLYHLAKRGWTDTILVEKGELTSGTTWHAAGNCPLYSHSYTMSRLSKDTVDFYGTFIAETGRDIGFHRSGSVKLSASPEQVTENARVAAMVRTAGITVKTLGPEELVERFPYLNPEGVLGAVWTPDDGHVDPSSLTNALADEARKMGAEVRRHTEVIGLRPRSSAEGGGWIVETTAGEIEAGQLINSAGLHGREVARLAGHVLPGIPIERQYLVTDDVPGIEELDAELPILRDISAPLYIRQERRSLLLGLFDTAPVFWAEDGTPLDFDTDLLPNDLDRVSHAFERALSRIPILNELGVKRVLNGPLLRSPDAAPLAGPVPGLNDYWLNTAYFGGFSQACETGARLARWITEGEPDREMSFADPRRFGLWAGTAYTQSRTRSAYIHEFSVVYPNEVVPSEMPARAGALYDTLVARGAVHGELAGWEVPNWFAPEGMEAKEVPSFDRANWFGPVGAECRAARESVAVMDFSAVARFELAGPGAAAALDRLCAGRIPRDPGGVEVNPMLSREGRLTGLILVAHPGPERYFITAPARAEELVADILTRALGGGSDAKLRNLSDSSGGLLLAGPDAAALLGRAAGTEMDETIFPRSTARAFAVGGVDILALREMPIGGPGFQLHIAAAELPALDAALRAAEPGLVDFGWRAFDSLRLEEGRPRWGIDMGMGSDPQGAGLGRHIAFDKGDFIGRAAFAARQGQEPDSGICLLALTGGAGKDGRGPDPAGSEVVWHGSKPVGLTSTGGFGHTLGRGLALAALPPALTAPGTAIEIEIYGKRHPAEVIEPPVG
ncbi:MAG: FAD-dependent oxidoreductase [Proteobacteria bacterium]|nr:FAD-dependent oxidoreductase [Pseudomonadota bacterium]